MTEPKLYIEVFNGFKITCEREGTRFPTPTEPSKTAMYKLLAYLASCGGHASRDDTRKVLFGHLIEADSDPDGRLRHEMAELRDYLSVFTEVDDRLFYLPRTKRKGFIDVSEHCVTDVGEFLNNFYAAQACKTPEQAREYLQAAIALYQGPLLPNYSDWDWVENRRADLQTKFEKACKQVEALQEIQAAPAPTTTALPSRIEIPNNLLMGEEELFLGRQREIELIKQFLREKKLVKLVGAGGSGKTRLAMKVAREIRQEYDAVWVLELAGSKDERELIEQISKDVGLKGKATLSELLTLVAKELRNRRVLTILDNCEHLLDSVSLLIDTWSDPGLQDGCPNLKVLLTSQFDLSSNLDRREAGTQLYQVDPFPLPDLDQLPSGEDLVVANAGVELFQFVAKTKRADFEVDDDNKEAVARICHALDGSPLAIRLVASRIGTFAPEDILAELTDFLFADTSSTGLAHRRHRTMSDCIQWTYSLLEEDERILLARLSLFRGGWTREQCEEVCGFEPLPPRAGRLLHRLADKSLVSFDTTQKRYRQLEPIRLFAEQQLEQSGLKAEMEKRISRWLDGVTDSVGDGLYVGDETADRSLTVALAARPDIDSAASHAETTDPEKAANLFVQSMVLDFAKGRVTDGNKSMNMLRKIVARLGNRPKLTIWVHVGEAVFAFMQSNYPLTVSAADKGLKLAREFGAKDRVAFACCGIGVAKAFLDDPTAEEQIEEGAKLAREIQNEWCIALSQACRGAWLWQSCKQFENEELLHRRLEAIEEYDKALEGFRYRAKNRLLTVFVLNSLAHLNARTGKPALAAAQYIDGLKSKNLRGMAGCVLGTCGLATVTGRFEESAVFYGAAMRHYNEIGAKLIPPVQVDYDKEVEEIRRQCGERYQELYERGSRLSLPDAVKLAQRFLECCRDGRLSEFVLEIPERKRVGQKWEETLRKR